jgi:carboxymethylenebutenolidase
MFTETINLNLTDGQMNAYIAYPEKSPIGAVIAIMEIWGVNETMKAHAHEFAQAGYICLVPDLFWRLDPDVILDADNPNDWMLSLERYFNFDYDLGAKDMEKTMNYLRELEGCNGKVGAVGYCLGGKMCYLLSCRTDIDCAVAYYGTYIEHAISEASQLSQPFMLHQALADTWVPPAICKFIEEKIGQKPNVEIHKYLEAEHAFARHGAKSYLKQEADLALKRSISFLDIHLK